MIYKINILRKRLVSVELSERKQASAIADGLCDCGWDVQEVRMLVKTQTAKLLITTTTDKGVIQQLKNDIEHYLLSKSTTN